MYQNSVDIAKEAQMEALKWAIEHLPYMTQEEKEFKKYIVDIAYNPEQFIPRTMEYSRRSSILREEQRRRRFYSRLL